MPAWTSFLTAMLLAFIRISCMVVFAPFFSSVALPVRTKAVFAGAVAFLLAPLIANLPSAHAEITIIAVLGEMGVGLVYGLMLSLLNEMLLFAGEIVGLQLSFSTVNLLDPTSPIQTPIISNLFQLMGILVLITSGLDRILLASIVRSFRAVPLGSFGLDPLTARAIVQAAGGVFLAAIELAAPVLAATMLVEIAVALLSKLSPQLPVMSLTVPLKTLVGFGVLTASLALWPRFIESQFAALLDVAERLLHAQRSIQAVGIGG